MKSANELYPLKAADAGFGEWEPAPVPLGWFPMHLPKSGYKFRPDLDGLIREQNGRPVVEVDEDDGPAICIVGNPRPEIEAAWAKETDGK